MNNIRTTFSIKDLENLSGIKAHTIRIWEKRYSLLDPKRTDTNIRTYDLEDLQKILNVSYLNNNGYKISKIAKLNGDEITDTVRSIAITHDVENHALNAFKLSMINYDLALFYKTYDSLKKIKSFEEIFNDAFIPLLNDIGLLWQTDTITPANEHFITSLIRQKIIANIENTAVDIDPANNRVFVLFLPLNEIHELALMFLHYQLVKSGIQTIYLGQSVPMDSLKDILTFYDKITFVSIFTIKPESDNIKDYLRNFNKDILNGNKHDFWIMGRKISEIEQNELPKKIIPFSSIDELYKRMNKVSKNLANA